MILMQTLRVQIFKSGIVSPGQRVGEVIKSDVLRAYIHRVFDELVCIV